MARTFVETAVVVLCCVLISARGFGQPGGRTSHDISGTWSGSFAIANPNGTVSHNQVVVRFEPQGSTLNGSIGSSIDSQSPFADGRIDGNVATFHLAAGRVTEFTLRLNKGHLLGRATGTGQNQSQHADIDLQPAPALLPHAELVKQISAADHRIFEGYESCDLSYMEAF